MKNRSPIAPIRADLEIGTLAILEIGRFAKVENGESAPKRQTSATYTHGSVCFQESEPDRADSSRFDNSHAFTPVHIPVDISDFYVHTYAIFTPHLRKIF